MTRVLQLDGVRGVAIGLVIIWHYFPCQVIKDSSPVLRAVARPFSLTWSGVDLFFVLSGFLIAGILLDQRKSENYLKVFYVRRTFRIFPLYFLLLGSFLVLRSCGLTSSPRLQWVFQDPFPLWSYALFIQNIYMGLKASFGPHWLAITWSLAVEEQFYLLLPLLIACFVGRRLIVVLAVVALTAPVLRGVWPGFHSFVNLPWRTDSLLAGALLAVLVRSPGFMEAVAAHGRGWTAALVVLLLGGVALTVYPKVFGPLDHSWLAGLFALFVLKAFVSGDSALGSVLQWRPLVWLGTHSYGIYMFHQPVSGTLHGLMRSRPPQLLAWGDAGITCLALLITLIAAAVSFRYFEAPLLRYSHSFKYRRAPSQDPAAATDGQPLLNREVR